jgi:hypothetical protein
VLMRGHGMKRCHAEGAERFALAASSAVTVLAPDGSRGKTASARRLAGPAKGRPGLAVGAFSRVGQPGLQPGGPNRWPALSATATALRSAPETMVGPQKTDCP